MHRTLIVARLNPEDAPAVADIFAESDKTELPKMIGVTRRTLFLFHGLYFHLVEAEEEITPRLYSARDHELYDDINRKLARYMTPYDPQWREPKDSMATPFYTWQPE
ncbi:TcmI family type II polyketide cyclase [Sinosporangium siamense]|uniref:Polyketide synthase n=1 Tax=Sinosporangium siamense TaxID=1367973 RepID=A0A919RJN9_9ACTN|nr:TcmI family type II polyketide cyclase [Sinosporangium siamense]GII95076.1 polyketide synthase [Sinosporangium siamense]